jgi:hypothetical protein
MKTKISKKLIRTRVEAAMKEVLTSFELSQPSKKTKKVVDRISKKLSSELKRDLKKQFKLSMVKANGVNGKKSKSGESKGQVVQAS